MKKVAVLLSILLFSSVAFAQVSTDPKDKFYTQVENWEILGVIPEQPPLRPYSLKLVEKILETVIEGDNEKEAEIAKEYYASIFNRPYKVRLEGTGNLRVNKDDNDKQLLGMLSVDGDYAFPSYVTAGYQLGFLGVKNSNNNTLPKYYLQPYYMRDPAKVGPLDTYLEMDANFAIGNERIYAQAGVNHNSFGLFYDDNMVFSSDAKHTANFSFVYNSEKWSYTQALFGLTASNNDGNEDLYSQKYMSLHSLNGQLLEWLTASFYEVTVYGGRFEPAYLIPVPYMVTQGLSGLDDNILMGMSFSIKPVKNFVWMNDFYIDDLSVNKLVKLNFDSKIRGTFQTGVKFIPEGVSFLGPIKMNYTLVTPYMYTHKQNVISNVDGSYFTGSESVINYQQYTTAGYPIGSGMDPNSDRIAFSAVIKPVKNLNVTLKGAYIRHANVNESLTVDEAISYLKSPEGYFTTDGSIANHQHYFEDGDPNEPEYLPSAWDHFLFMCQDTKMHTFQAGLDIDYTLPRMKFGTVSLGLNYLFEYIINSGVDSEIFTGRGPKNYVYSKNSTYNAPEVTEADVKAALDEWKSRFKNVMNNYVTVTLKYVW